MIYGLNKVRDEESRRQLARLLKTEGHRRAFAADDYSVVRNPAGVYPPFDIYPLPRPELQRLPGLDIILMDMDGTTTTTEVLCLHSLEESVRRMSGNPGLVLDKTRDYPHIIGNSTTRHVEYLMAEYRGSFDLSATKAAFLEAVAWTIRHSKDKGRQNEARTARDLFLYESPSAISDINEILLVRIGVEIYYQRYHFILSSIDKGEGDDLSAELTGGRPLIEPMEGIALFLVFIKGWLGEELDFIQEYFKLKPASFDKLRNIAGKFADHSTGVGLITSSTSYEASIVLSEVFRLIRKEISEWPISAARKKSILARFKSYGTYYDAVVTASDSSEIRLKPHRDLYSIALQRLAYKPGYIVLGLEDSESGILALRAAGVPYAVAVPFEHTRGHDLQAAWKVADGGARSVLFDDLLFLET